MASIQHLLSAHAITAAQTIATRGKVHRLPIETAGLTVEAIFVYAAAGTNVTAYIQTSFDNQETWMDIMAFRFTTASLRRVLSVRQETAITSAITPSDGALTVDTAVSGIIGQHVRARVVTTGTYTGTNTLDLWLRIED